MFFNDWEGIWRTLLVGTIAYVALVLLLRVSGKRTLSKMNAFDFVVTVALGSTLASILLSKDVPLAEGISALALLIMLQFVVAWTSVRSKHFSRLVNSQPALLFYRGQFVRSAMKEERVTEEEVRAAIREQGPADVKDVMAVVLETSGNLAVLPDSGTVHSPSLSGVSNYPPDSASS